MGSVEPPAPTCLRPWTVSFLSTTIDASNLIFTSNVFYVILLYTCSELVPEQKVNVNAKKHG